MPATEITVPAKPTLTELKRSNSTIGLVIDDRYEYTANHRKLYAAILLVSQNQPTASKFRAYLQDLISISGVSAGNISEVKKLLKKIRDTSGWFEWTNDEDEVEHHLVGMIDRSTIYDGRRGKRIIVEWEIDPKIRQQIIDPANLFTRIYLENITKLRKGHSIALYEIACQYEKLNRDMDGWGSTGKRSVAQWASVLIGNEKKEYEFALFNRDILKPALAEVNKESNLDIQPIFIKEGRRVLAIEFKIRSKAKEQDCVESGADDNSVEIDPRLYQLLGSLPISKLVIKKILHDYKDPDYIKKHATQMKAKLDSGIKINNPNGYIVSAFQNDYTDKPAQPTQQFTIQVDETKKAITELEQADIQAKSQKQIDDEIIKEVLELEADQRELIINEWLNQEANVMVKNLYRTKGLNHVLTAKNFVAWRRSVN